MHFVVNMLILIYVRIGSHYEFPQLYFQLINLIYFSVGFSLFKCLSEKKRSANRIYYVNDQTFVFS